MAAEQEGSTPYLAGWPPLLSVPRPIQQISSRNPRWGS